MARTAVVAGTATAVSNRVSRRQADRWSQQSPQYSPGPQYYEPAPAYQAPPPPASPSAPDLPVEQLKQLGDLRDQGILTDEEFAAQKAKLLGL